MADVIGQLKTLQADSFVLFAKIHNYHWNVKGIQFYPVHEMTEKVYDKMATLYDDCAERVLQLGQKPYVTISEMVGAARVKEESVSDFEAKYVLEKILVEYESILKALRELSDTAGAANDKATVAFADERIQSYEKDIWMLKAALG